LRWWYLSFCYRDASMLHDVHVVYKKRHPFYCSPYSVGIFGWGGKSLQCFAANLIWTLYSKCYQNQSGFVENMTKIFRLNFYYHTISEFSKNTTFKLYTGVYTLQLRWDTLQWCGYKYPQVFEVRYITMVWLQISSGIWGEIHYNGVVTNILRYLNTNNCENLAIFDRVIPKKHAGWRFLSTKCVVFTVGILWLVMFYMVIFFLYLTHKKSLLLLLYVIDIFDIETHCIM